MKTAHLDDQSLPYGSKAPLIWTVRCRVKHALLVCKVIFGKTRSFLSYLPKILPFFILLTQVIRDYSRLILRFPQPISIFSALSWMIHDSTALQAGLLTMPFGSASFYDPRFQITLGGAPREVVVEQDRIIATLATNQLGLQDQDWESLGMCNWFDRVLQYKISPIHTGLLGLEGICQLRIG